MLFAACKQMFAARKKLPVRASAGKRFPITTPAVVHTACCMGPKHPALTSENRDAYGRARVRTRPG